MSHTKLIPLVALLVLAVNVANAQNDSSWASTAETTFTPKVHHPNIAGVTLFAQNPDIVTPVGIAVAPDGRIWRVEFKQPVRLEPLPRDAKPEKITPEVALNLLGSDDPYVRTQAMHVLSENSEVLEPYNWQVEKNPVARAHYAVTLKRTDADGHKNVIPALLKDPNHYVRFVGIKWITDQRLDQYRNNLEQLLNRSDLSRLELRAVIAALSEISGDLEGEFSPENKMLELALDSTKPAGLRAVALRGVNVNHKQLTIDTLASLLREKNKALQREAVRSLVLHSDVAKLSILAELAADKSLTPNLRADAIAGMAALAADQSKLLESLARDKNKTVAAEAFRTLVSAGLAMRKLKSKPPIDDINAWQTLVNEASGEADTAVGRRLFFHSKLGGCYKCHAMNGRGNHVGPDLTTIRNQSGITPNWLLGHIVNPNAEMAPYYRPQLLLTFDGEVLTGLIAGREGNTQGYVGADGVIFYVGKEVVEERRELTTSIMPSGLLDKMDANEIRDLIAYLLQEDKT